jgi:hypothetical protein
MKQAAATLVFLLALAASAWATPQAARPSPSPSPSPSASPTPREEKPLFSDDSGQSKEKKDAESLGVNGVPKPTPAPKTLPPPRLPKGFEKKAGAKAEQQRYADQQAAIRARQKAQAAALGVNGHKKPDASAQNPKPRTKKKYHKKSPTAPGTTTPPTPPATQPKIGGRPQ